MSSHSQLKRASARKRSTPLSCTTSNSSISSSALCRTFATAAGPRRCVYTYMHTCIHTHIHTHTHTHTCIISPLFFEQPLKKLRRCAQLSETQRLEIQCLPGDVARSTDYDIAHSVPKPCALKFSACQATMRAALIPIQIS